MTKTQGSGFLSYLHSFRGFAILNIVAIHAFGFALWASNNNSFDPKNTFNIINEVLFHNSTVYFSIISGLLFSSILKSKGYKAFYISKVKNVLFPYIFLTLVFSIFNPGETDFFILHTDFMLFVKGAIRNFVYGKALFTFWYIPVLIFLYMVTPLLDYIIHIKRYGTPLILLIILLPLYISRVELMEMDGGDFFSLHTMIYFMGAYAAGIYFGFDLEERMGWVKKHMTYLLIATFICTIALFYLEYAPLQKIGHWSLTSTLYYIQKMSLTGIFIILFKNMGEKQPACMHTIARDAFTIYFLHAFFLILLIDILAPISGNHNIEPFNFILGAILFFTLSIVLSMLVAYVFRKLFGRYSRSLIGS